MNLRLLGTLLLAHLTTDLAQGMIPALLPFFIAERRLSFAAAGGLVLAATVASSIVQPLFGYFADRRPSPWLVPAGVAAAGIGVGLAGIAPTYPLIAAAVAFHGLGVAAFHPEGSRAAAYASGERRATGMSIFSTGGNLGMTTGPLVFVGVLGTSKARGAAALSILLGTGVVGTFVGGRLADRSGRRIVLLVGMTALAPLLFASVLPLLAVALALTLPDSRAGAAPKAVRA